MTNVAALASITGRLVRPIKWFEPNKDGSISGAMTLAVDNNYKSADGEVKTNFLPTRIFIPASAGGDKRSWDLVGEGDLIQALFTLSANAYTDKNGERVYPNAVTLTADGWPNFLEHPDVTKARREAKAAEAAAAAAAAAADATPAQPTVEELEAQIAALQAASEEPF